VLLRDKVVHDLGVVLCDLDLDLERLACADAHAGVRLVHAAVGLDRDLAAKHEQFVALLLGQIAAVLERQGLLGNKLLERAVGVALDDDKLFARVGIKDVLSNVQQGQLKKKKGYFSRRYFDKTPDQVEDARCVDNVHCTEVLWIVAHVDALGLVEEVEQGLEQVRRTEALEVDNGNELAVECVADVLNVELLCLLFFPFCYQVGNKQELVPE